LSPQIFVGSGKLQTWKVFSISHVAAYSPASAGVIAFPKALSRHVSDPDIRVNCIAPGPIDTRPIRNLGNETVDAMISTSPLKRLGGPQEVAALVVCLCSDASAFNTALSSTCPAVSTILVDVATMSCLA
jgi:NAD(P)-dependent dehydrogenase (short-subunit alcohol dehydrogenase family)